MALPVSLDQATDSDGVALAAPVAQQPAGFEQRYGRLVMDNTYGPETESLAMAFRVQYLSGGNFVTNIDDSCWHFDTSQASASGLTGVAVTASAGTMSQGQPTDTQALELSPPAMGTSGTATVTWNVDAWLRDDWNADGALDLPTALATFGVYRGNDHIIYWREVGQ